MPSTYTVTKAKYAGEKDNPHGGKLHKFYCSFVDEAGNGESDVYWQRKSEESPEGEQFYGHIENGQYGKRFKTDQQQNGGSPHSGGSSGAKDDYWQAKEQRDIESQARMGRAHAQEMALRFSAQFDESPTVESYDDHKKWIKELADWFHADVQRFPTSEGPQSENGASVTSADREGSASTGGRQGTDPPSEATSTRVGFVSDKQKGFFERLLKQGGLDSNQVEAIKRFTEQLPTDRVSKAIDGLNDDDTERAEKTVAALIRESDAWARLQTDVPFEENA